jgi:pimeloyl-ACP methyl ester carboxylesterase
MKREARVVAMDLRGHGLTQTENNSDLSIEVCSHLCHLEYIWRNIIISHAYDF